MERYAFPDLNEIRVEMEKLWKSDKDGYERRRLEILAKAIVDAPESMRDDLLKLQQEINVALGSEQNPAKRAKLFQEYFEKKALGKNGFVSQVLKFNESDQLFC